MINKIVVLSKKDAERYTPSDKAILVRVFSSGKYDKIVDLRNKYLGVLNLKFDDVIMTPEDTMWNMFDLEEEYKGLIFPEEKHMSDFITFVSKWEKEAEELVIHCDAGESRSPALAIGLCYRKGWADKELELRRRFRMANHLVLDLLEGKRR